MPYKLVYIISAGSKSMLEAKFMVLETRDTFSLILKAYLPCGAVVYQKSDF